MGQRNRSCLHAAHRQSRHSAMRLIRNRAIGGIDVGNQFVDENVLERVEIEAAPAGSTSARRAACRGTSGAGLASAATGSAAGWSAAPPTATDSAAVIHHDDEWFAFPLCKQIVDDQAGMTLISPTGFVLAGAMLQIKHRVTL